MGEPRHTDGRSLAGLSIFLCAAPDLATELQRLARIDRQPQLTPFPGVRQPLQGQPVAAGSSLLVPAQCAGRIVGQFRSGFRLPGEPVLGFGDAPVRGGANQGNGLPGLPGAAKSEREERQLVRGLGVARIGFSSAEGPDPSECLRGRIRLQQQGPQQ